jgi:hypothetical protein
MFDTLKTYGIVPEDSQINDYDFLFDFTGEKEKTNNFYYITNNYSPQKYRGVKRMFW